MVFNINYSGVDLTVEYYCDKGITSIKSKDNMLDFFDDYMLHGLEKIMRQKWEKEKIVKFITKEFVDTNQENYNEDTIKTNEIVNRISMAILSDRLNLGD